MLTLAQGLRQESLGPARREAAVQAHPQVRASPAHLVHNLTIRDYRVREMPGGRDSIADVSSSCILVLYNTQTRYAAPLTECVLYNNP